MCSVVFIFLLVVCMGATSNFFAMQEDSEGVTVQQLRQWKQEDKNFVYTTPLINAVRSSDINSVINHVKQYSQQVNGDVRKIKTYVRQKDFRGRTALDFALHDKRVQTAVYLALLRHYPIEKFPVDDLYYTIECKKECSVEEVLSNLREKKITDISKQHIVPLIMKIKKKMVRKIIVANGMCQSQMKHMLIGKRTLVIVDFII